MSKSMAIEGVMKIFLMIAVIIVGMSFLLKAFGIDIFGWLQNLFGGFGVPSSGKILYAKTDPDDKQVFAFFITDDSIQEIEKGRMIGRGDIRTYFLPDKLDDKSCVIYTVKERDSTLLGDAVPDKGYYYYVKPGASIQQKSCESIGECIKDFTSKEQTGCNPRNVKCSDNPLENKIELDKCSRQLRGEFVVGDCGCAAAATCDDSGDILDRGTDRKVEKEIFQSNYNFVDFCDESKPTSKCNLLKPGEYNIQYGLLCGDDGKWHTCKAETNNEITARVNDNNIDCNPDGGVYVWDEEKVKSVTTKPPSLGSVTYISSSKLCATSKDPKDAREISTDQTVIGNNCEKEDFWKITPREKGRLLITLKNAGNRASIAGFLESDFASAPQKLTCSKLSNNNLVCTRNVDPKTYYIRADPFTDSSREIEFSLSSQ